MLSHLSYSSSSFSFAIPPLVTRAVVNPARVFIRYMFGHRHTSIAVVLSLSTLVAARVWYKYIRVPRHLAHLPRLSMSYLAIKTLSGHGFLQVVEGQKKLIRKDSVARGYTRSLNETPKLWLLWLLGQWTVMVNNPTDVNHVYTHNEIFDKLDFFKRVKSPTNKLLGANIVSSKTPEWKHHRRVVNPAFRRGWSTSIFGVLTRSLMAQIDSHINKGLPVDVSVYMQRITLDALSSAAFGRNLNSINQPDSSLVSLYNEVILAALDPTTVILSPIAFLLPSQRNINQKVDKFNEFLYDLIDVKIAQVKKKQEKKTFEPINEDDDDTRDLMELMVSAMLKNPTEFSREDVRADTMIFFIAGHDTTANALTFAFYLMGRHPDIQAKARAEVIKVMGDISGNSDVNEAPFPSNQQERELRYLTCVIKEILRLYPPVTSLPLRCTTEDYKFSDGTFLPKGSLATINIWGVHRSEDNWGDTVNDFIPERWESLNLTSDGVIPLHPGAHDFKWGPFGGGSRACLGQQFSMIEQRVILGMMLLRYEWSVVGNEAALNGTPDSSPGILLHATNVFIQFKKRN